MSHFVCVHCVWMNNFTCCKAATGLLFIFKLSMCLLYMFVVVLMVQIIEKQRESVQFQVHVYQNLIISCTVTETLAIRVTCEMQ